MRTGLSQHTSLRQELRVNLLVYEFVIPHSGKLPLSLLYLHQQADLYILSIGKNPVYHYP